MTGLINSIFTSRDLRTGRIDQGRHTPTPSIRTLATNFSVSTLTESSLRASDETNGNDTATHVMADGFSQSTERIGGVLRSFFVAFGRLPGETISSVRDVEE